MEEAQVAPMAEAQAAAMEVRPCTCACVLQLIALFHACVQPARATDAYLPQPLRCTAGRSDAMSCVPADSCDRQGWG